MIDDRPVSDRQGFVVAVTPLQEDPWDVSLKNVVLGIEPDGWEFYRTSPHPLLGLRPAEVAYRKASSTAMVSLYATHQATIPEHIYVTGCESPLRAIKQVLELE